MSNMQIAEAANPNSGSFDKLIAEAEELGKQAGRGKDTQIKFYLRVFDAAYHGHIDLTPDKHGISVDDAQKVTEAFVKAQQGAVVFDGKAAHQRGAASKTRQIIKAGGWTGGGSGEPLQTANNLINIRQKLRADPANAKKLHDAGNTFMTFCRKLLKSNTLPDDFQMRAMCFKPDAEDQTEDDFIVALRKRMQKIRDHKGGVEVDTKFANAIIDECTKRLTAIAKSKDGTSTPKQASTQPQAAA